jgi:hypothetical protein
MSKAMGKDSEQDEAHRKLRVTMAAGSLYDFTFAMINLAAPGLGSWFLEIPLPAQQIYLRFTGVFLLMAALFYMLPVIHPGRYLGNVVVAILGRAVGGVFMITAALAFAEPPAFILLGGGDLIFASLHLYYLARAEGGNPFRHYIE